VLDTLTEKDFQKSFKNGPVVGTGIYMREENTSRVMAADRSYGEFYYFYISPEYFGYSLVFQQKKIGQCVNGASGVEFKNTMS
jgi:hypothetical protein